MQIFCDAASYIYLSFFCIAQQAQLSQGNGHSVAHQRNFNVTDTAKSIPVVYKGFLPDLFKEGKGVVAHGKLDSNNVFRADEVLAKHDENYMAPEATYALDQAVKGQSAVNAVPVAGAVPSEKY